jgi:hypothetical protein
MPSKVDNQLAFQGALETPESDAVIIGSTGSLENADHTRMQTLLFDSGWGGSQEEVHPRPTSLEM